MTTDSELPVTGPGLLPIPGEKVDPPPKKIASTLAKVDRKGVLVGSGFRAFLGARLPRQGRQFLDQMAEKSAVGDEDGLSNLLG